MRMVGFRDGDRKKNTDRQDCQRSYARTKTMLMRKQTWDKKKDANGNDGECGYLISGCFLGGPTFLLSLGHQFTLFGPKKSRLQATTTVQCPIRQQKMLLTTR